MEPMTGVLALALAALIALIVYAQHRVREGEMHERVEATDWMWPARDRQTITIAAVDREYDSLARRR